ncbi:sugar ABC transporter substrate-binding protein, partial [Paenarthrobacter aurescens]|uniref:sugar ABC transporter substrate-binding protein n=1 Tax=Paenarthrobacter aurescens TaxID=43663 RepID=UPI0035ED8401
ETNNVSETVKALVQEASGEQVWEGPLQGPIAEPGKVVVSIPCGLAAPGCARWDAGLHEAAKVLGWDVKTIDPAFDPAKANDAITQAINLGADAIVTVAWDPALFANSIAAAREKGIVVVTAAAGYEDKPIKKDFINYDINGNSPLAGRWTAAALCEGMNAKGTALLIDDPQYLVATQRIDAAQELLSKECPNIKVIRQTASITDSGTVGQSKAVALLQANPDINAILLNSDPYASDFLVAMEQLGLNDAIDVYSMGAEEHIVSNMKAGGPVKADVGQASEHQGWSTLDATNRLLQGEPGPGKDKDGIQQRLVTPEWIPDGGSYVGDVDFRAKYAQLWTTGKTQG